MASNRWIFDQVAKSALQLREIDNALKNKYYIEALVILEQSLEIVAEAYLGRELIKHGFKARKRATYGGGQLDFLSDAGQEKHRTIVSLLFDLSLITNSQKEVFDRVRKIRNEHVHDFEHYFLDKRKVVRAVKDGLQLLDDLERLGAIDPTD